MHGMLQLTRWFSLSPKPILWAVPSFLCCAPQKNSGSLRTPKMSTANRPRKLLRRSYLSLYDLGLTFPVTVDSHPALSELTLSLGQIAVWLESNTIFLPQWNVFRSAHNTLFGGTIAYSQNKMQSDTHGSNSGTLKPRVLHILFTGWFRSSNSWLFKSISWLIMCCAPPCDLSVFGLSEIPLIF